jgi:hypothetical protein
MRDFPAEVEYIRRHSRDAAGSRLVVDCTVYGKMASYFRSGVVISGPDCMSRQYRQIARFSTRFSDRLRARLRSWYAAGAERQWLHLADVVHTVSEMDRQAMLAVNPRMNVVVLPLGLKSPSKDCLRPWSERRGGVIWGNLCFSPTRVGIVELLEQAVRAGVRLKGWKLLGKMPKAQAVGQFPCVEASGVEYLEWVENVGDLLATSRFLVCPDIGGAGQKNRVLDGLAYGCVVAGLPEAFRDLQGVSGQHYVELRSLAGFPASVESGGDLEAISRQGRRLFEDHFSLEALGRNWNRLLEGCGPLVERGR